MQISFQNQTATINDVGVYVDAGNSGAVWSEAFVYDNRSNLVQKTDARNVKSNYTYTKPDTSEDPLNRIQKISYDISGSSNVLPAPDVTYSYLTSGDKARISSVRTAGILTENFSYDTEGRLYESTETVDGRTSYPMTMTYLYDSLDRTKEVRYPAQYGLAGSPRKIIEPTYDVASRLSSLKVNSVVQAGDIVYNSSDQTESIKIGASGANQVTETYEYDGLSGLLMNQKVIKGGSNLLDLNYDYAKNNSIGTGTGKTGHLTKITDNLNNAKNKEYEFDALGRLTKAKGGTNNLWQQQYGYDRYGNRETVAASGNGIDNAPMQADGMSYSTDKQTNRITTAGFEYDVAGNMTKGQDQSGTWLKYEYDAANRLQVIKKDSDNSYVQAFQFGSTNQRLMDVDYGYGYLKIFGHGGAVEYTEFAGNVLSWTKTYVYLGDSILSMITPSGNGGENTEFNHSDRLGTRIVTNQTTGTYTEQTTLPFGTGLASETSRAESKRFTCYDRSARTGLDYAINRTYDSKLGRFTQVDPIGMISVNFDVPQTLNLYNYCGNDPINHTDPDGLFWGAIGRFFKKAFKWIAVAIAVAVAVLTIIYAPVLFSTTLKLVFGVISALASATSAVLSAFGYSKAAAIFGIIAAVAGLGTAVLAARSSLNAKTLLAAISAGATATGRTLSLLGYTKIGQYLGIFATTTGFISDGLKFKPNKETGIKELKWDSSMFKIYKYARNTAQQIANLVGNTRVAGFLDVIGYIDDTVDSYLGAKRFFENDVAGGEKVFKLDVLKNTKTELTGIKEFNARFGIFIRNVLVRSGTQNGLINSRIRRAERAFALAR